MPKNYTENYHLSQWEPEDQVLRADFNADNAAIDAALADKADQTALDGLEQTVASLSGTVQQHTSSMTALGNCQLQRSTYVGNGEETRTITLPEKTLLAFIHGENYTCATAIRGITQVICTGGMGLSGNIIATWADKSVKFEFKAGNFNAAQTICNLSGVTYHVIALRSLS